MANQTKDPGIMFADDETRGARIKVVGSAAAETPLSRMISSGLSGDRVHRGEHRPPGAALEPRAREDPDRRQAHQGSGRRRQPRRGAAGGRRGHREDLRRPRGRRHGLHHHRPRRGNRHGRRARGGLHRRAARRRDRGRPHRGRGDAALRPRGQAAHGPGPGGARPAQGVRRLGHRHSQRPAAPDRGPQHAGLRGLPRRRRRAATGRPGDQRHHHRSRARSTSTSPTCGR